MKDIVVIGAGGFGREVGQLIKDINQEKKEWNFLGYIDENIEKHGTVLNGDCVIGGESWLEGKRSNNIWAVCAIGNTKIKYEIVSRIDKIVMFPNLIHPSVLSNNFIEFGVGNIICAKSILSINIKIGNQVAINPGCSIGHDTVINDYTTLMWDVTLSGNVLVNEGCEIGSKTVVIQQKTIGKWCIIGAGAVVVRDLPENCTAVGVPAKPIKYDRRFD